MGNKTYDNLSNKFKMSDGWQINPEADDPAPWVPFVSLLNRFGESLLSSSSRLHL